MAANRPCLAHVHQGVLDPVGAQKLDDAVGDVTLTDAVQGHAHAGFLEPQTRPVDVHCHMAHTGDRCGEGVVRRAVHQGVRRREMPGIEFPQAGWTVTWKAPPVSSA